MACENELRNLVIAGVALAAALPAAATVIGAIAAAAAAGAFTAAAQDYANCQDTEEAREYYRKMLEELKRLEEKLKQAGQQAPVAA